MRYDKRVEAERAIEALHDKIPETGTDPLTVKFANNQQLSKPTLHYDLITEVFLFKSPRWTTTTDVIYHTFDRAYELMLKGLEMKGTHFPTL